MNKKLHYIFILFCWLSSWQGLHAQIEEVETDTTEPTQIIVINSDFTKGFNKNERSELSGNVILRQDSTVIYADRVNLLSATNAAKAFGNVIIQRSDTTNAYCDELDYDGNRQYATMIGDVVLENGVQKLFSDRLEYDMKNNVAYYKKNSVMTDGERLISSKAGQYYLDSSLVIFHDSVVVKGPDYTMRTDSLHFNTVTRTAYFMAPIRMKQRDNDIYAETGYYNLIDNFAELRENAQFSSPRQDATADTILFYGQSQDFTLIGNTWVKEADRVVTANRIEYKKSTDKAILIGNVDYKDAEQRATGERMEYTLSTGAFKTEGRAEIVQGSQIMKADNMRERESDNTVIASGNVVWIDTAQQVSLYSSEAIIDRENERVKAFGDELLFITQMEGDSLFMTADTLLSGTVVDSNDQSIRQIFAYFNVVGYKNNLQFKADSMTYSEQDSLFRIFGQPVIWSDTSRFYGDTINVQLNNQNIDRIYLIDNAFIVNKNYENLFNQVKGRRITARFLEQQLESAVVRGNAESVYYAVDESGGFIGVNKIICSEMKLYFGNNQVSEIRFYQKPTSVFHPMNEINHDELKLEGFSFESKYRSNSPLDIYRVHQLMKSNRGESN